MLKVNEVTKVMLRAYIENNKGLIEGIAREQAPWKAIISGFKCTPWWYKRVAGNVVSAIFAPGGVEEKVNYFLQQHIRLAGETMRRVLAPKTRP